MTTEYQPPTSSQGYIPLKEYVEDVTEMMRFGPWKLPLSLKDRIHFFLLSGFFKISFFSSRLYINHSSSFRPAYSLILSFLKRNGVYDFIWDRSISRRGYFSFLLEKKIVTGDSVLRLYGQGVSMDKTTALSIAIGEMLERTITGRGDNNKNVLYCSPAELINARKEIVYPPLFHGYLDVQKTKYPSLCFSPMTSQMSWVKGINVATGTTTYIPKRMTTWFKEKITSDEPLVHATTNGSAGYFSKEEALLRGILEVVQRDGFLVHWLTQTPPEVVELTSLPDKLFDSIKKLQVGNVQVHLVNISSLGIPSVALVGIGVSVTGKRQVVVSAGCALSFAEAIESATRELAIALEMLSYPKDLHELEGIDWVIEPFVSNLDKIGRQLYWRGEDKMARFSWFLSGKRTLYQDVQKRDLIKGKSASDDLLSMVRTLREYGKEYEPVVYYPQNPIQEQLGFYVAQVFIPKAFPLYLFEGYGTFESRRLQEFAAMKGCSNFVLNPEPHMFS